jgi:hypothetical protein
MNLENKIKDIRDVPSSAVWDCLYFYLWGATLDSRKAMSQMTGNINTHLIELALEQELKEYII